MNRNNPLLFPNGKSSRNKNIFVFIVLLSIQVACNSQIETHQPGTDNAEPTPSVSDGVPIGTMPSIPGGKPNFTLQPPSTPTPTLSPTITATPNGIERYKEIYYRQVPPALSLMFQNKYPQAIDEWDDIIRELPDYGYAYYQRALSRLRLAVYGQNQEEVTELLKSALADIDRSMDLGPLTGDHHLLRYEIYKRYAWMASRREERSTWFEKALSDTREADRLGNSDPWSYLYPVELLNDLGLCQEALEESARLISELDGGDRNPNLHKNVARSYLCLGVLDPALAHIDLSLDLSPNRSSEMVKTIILFNMGEVPEALAILDPWIEESPDYYGERYFFRALIHYDLGDFEAARRDYAAGVERAWEIYGLGAYVEGSLLAQDGELEESNRKIVYAEETLEYAYGPLLNRIRRDMEIEIAETSPPDIPENLAGFLTATPSIRGTVTPQPPIENSDLNYYITRDLAVPYLGTGPFNLDSDPKGITFYFEPNAPIEYDSIESLDFILAPEDSTDPLDLYLLLFHYDRPDAFRGSPGIRLEWGENPYPLTEGFVNRFGGLYVRLINQGAETVAIENLGLRLVVVNTEGETEHYGIK